MSTLKYTKTKKGTLSEVNSKIDFPEFSMKSFHITDSTWTTNNQLSDKRFMD